MVPVAKKNVETLFCLDFRKLNQSIIQDSYPLPGIDVLIDKCAGHKIYSAWMQCMLTSPYHWKLEVESIQHSPLVLDYWSFVDYLLGSVWLSV